MNLPKDILLEIDKIIEAARQGYPDAYSLVPVMVQSRDEYIRLAVSILMMATTRNAQGIEVLSAVKELVERLEKADREQ